jgi:arginine exporter protein ArgO
VKDTLKLLAGFVGVFLLMAALPILFLFLIAYVLVWMAVDIMGSISRESDENYASATHKEERRGWCRHYKSMAEKENHGKA